MHNFDILWGEVCTKEVQCFYRLEILFSTEHRYQIDPVMTSYSTLIYESDCSRQWRELHLSHQYFFSPLLDYKLVTRTINLLTAPPALRIFCMLMVIVLKLKRLWNKSAVTDDNVCEPYRVLVQESRTERNEDRRMAKWKPFSHLKAIQLIIWAYRMYVCIVYTILIRL